jgi:hypothetical protein
VVCHEFGQFPSIILLQFTETDSNHHGAPQRECAEGAIGQRDAEELGVRKSDHSGEELLVDNVGVVDHVQDSPNAGEGVEVEPGDTHFLFLLSFPISVLLSSTFSCSETNQGQGPEKQYSLKCNRNL